MATDNARMTNQELGDYQYQLGLGAASNGDYSCAINHFSEAVNLSPNHWDAYYNRAVCHANCNQIQKALGEMEALHDKMAAKGQASVQVALCISDYNFSLGQFGCSIEWGKCALQFPGHHENGEALVRIARAYFELKRPYRAHMYLTAHINTGSSSNLRNCYLLRSSCYQQENMLVFALADLEKANDIKFEQGTENLIQEMKARLANQQVTYPQKTIRSYEESAFTRD